MNPAPQSDNPARPAFGRAVAFWRAVAPASAPVAPAPLNARAALAALAAPAALIALVALGAGCGRYVPGTIAPSTRATLGAAWDGDAAVSPDGKRVAFVSERADGHRGLYVLPARAARFEPGKIAPTALVTGPFDIARPSWSHDGHRVRFTRFDPADG